jgi:hypothetical protein
MAEICAFIKEIGFPIFVSVYLLLRFEPQLARLSEAIAALTVVVQNCNGQQYAPQQQRPVYRLKLARRLWKNDTLV